MFYEIRLTHGVRNEPHLMCNPAPKLVNTPSLQGTLSILTKETSVCEASEVNKCDCECCDLEVCELCDHGREHELCDHGRERVQPGRRKLSSICCGWDPAVFVVAVTLIGAGG